MKFERLAYAPDTVLDFYEAGLTALGALCSRPWHDRLEVLAEGRAAALWNSTGALHAGELQFVAADATGARDAAVEIFPGCPLTFALADALRAPSLALERVVIAGDAAHARAPEPTVAEKLWRAQFPDTAHWRLATPLTRDFHFSLVALARCEIQAIDQQWALHRVAVALPGGHSDAGLAREIGFAQAIAPPAAAIEWPAIEPARWGEFLQHALEHDLAEELRSVRARQQTRLNRELERIDSYFENYAQELGARSRGASAKVKVADRLAAAKAEHARHRADQIARHEIVVHPHLDALLLVAEPAWRATVKCDRARQPQASTARFIPRARRWEVLGS